MNTIRVGEALERVGREPSKETLASALAVRLREAILSGELLPGTRLRLSELGDRFGVSLSPLREALSRLSIERLVIMEDQRGCRVAPVSAADCREVVALRTEFESYALREAIRNGDDDWEAALVAAFHRLNKRSPGELRDAPARAEWERLHRSYHQALISACAMPMLIQLCGQLSDMYDRYRRLFLARRPGDAAVLAEHEAIVSAAIARDAKRATTLLRTHIERTGANVVSFVERAAVAGERRRAKGG